MTPRRWLLLAAIAGLLALGLWLRQSGALDSRALSADVDALGAWAVPGFLVLFMVGGLIPLPGTLFVVVSRLVFGPTLGFIAAYIGALLAVSLAFFLVRTVLRERPRDVRLPFEWAQRLLERAEARPVFSVVVLRTIFGMAPPLNYGLGFTPLRTRHYLGGSALGLIGPVAVVTFATGLFL